MPNQKQDTPVFEVDKAETRRKSNRALPFHTTYDQMGRLKNHRQSIDNQSYNLEYGYNLAGQMTSETYPSGKVVNMNYDANGRLASVNDAGRTYLNNLQYQGKGNSVSSMSLGNGTTQTLALNDRLQMTQQNLSRGSEVLQKYDYGYGQIDSSGNLDTTKNNGQLAKVESYIGANKQWTQKFNYDSIGRLSQASEYRGDNNNLSYKQKFDFDRFGNLYRKNASNPTTGQETPLAYTPIEDSDISKATNRFTTNTTYDDAGNVVTDNKFRQMSFAYDANGRMVRATKANAPDAVSVYDAGGQRVAEKVNDIWKFSIYDIGGKVVAEYGGLQATDGGGVKYVLTDWQGSTRAVVSNSGFVQARMDYQAFGEEIQAGTGQRTTAQGFGASNNLPDKYALTKRDEATGLDHTWFRKNENRAGRWTSPDPYNGSMSLGNPQSFNRYSYVENQPTNFVDPSGLDEDPLATVQSERAYDDEIFSTLYDLMRGGGGGGGVGGENIPRQEAPPSTCAQYAATLAASALGWSSLPGGLLTLGRVWGYHAKNGLSKSKDENKKNLFLIDGVKANLTDGGQGADVYKHIVGVAGATLIGSNRIDPTGIKTTQTGDDAFLEQNTDDLNASLGFDPFHSAEEGRTELVDNKAGVNIGNKIKEIVLNKSLSSIEKQAKVEKAIFDELCDF